jgi:hypothetical protein
MTRGCQRGDKGVVSMKRLIITLVLLAPVIAVAADTPQVQEMKQKCEKERTSMFRDNNGTPTCDQLDKMSNDYNRHTVEMTEDLRAKCDKEQNSMFRENSGTPSCTRLNEKLQDRAKVPLGNGLRYSNERGKNCYFNDAGEVQSCP